MKAPFFNNHVNTFYLAWHKVKKSCFRCILSKVMINFACSVMGKPFLAILEDLKLKFSFGASAPTMVGPKNLYSRKTVPKCDFNKVTRQLYWNHTLARLFSCKFAAYFQNTFLSEHLLRAAFVLPPIYYSHEAARRMSTTKGNSKAAGCMTANLLKMNFFTCIIKKFY